MLRSLSVFVALVSVFPAFLRAAEPEARTVRSSGSATVYVKPDEVEVTFSVHTFDSDLVKSKAANDQAVRQVIDFVKSLKVDENDIQSDAMRSERVYEPAVRDRPAEFKGYTVRRAYSIVLRDVAKLDALADHLLVRPDITIGGINFRTSQSRKFRDEARRKAVRAAREKAELMASELNCAIGRAQTINEQSPPTYGYAMQNYTNSNAHDEGGGAGADGGSGATHLGQIAMMASVEVTFDLLGGAVPTVTTRPNDSPRDDK